MTKSMSLTVRPSAARPFIHTSSFFWCHDGRVDAVLIVADATIDQDGMTPGLHDVGLEAQYQVVLGIERRGRQPGSVLRQHLGRQLGQELQALA